MNWDRERAVVGAIVAVPLGVLGRQHALRKIERLTATQAIIDDGRTRVRLDNGRVVGSEGWATRYVYTPTPEEIEQIRAAQRRAALRDVDWKLLTDDEVYVVWSIAQGAKQRGAA